MPWLFFCLVNRRIFMHRIFGRKEDNKTYTDRSGAYLIPIQDGKVALVRTPKGLFLLGGGIKDGETDVQAICRECLEEIGCTAVVGKVLCSAEAFLLHPEIGYFHPMQIYYAGILSGQIQKSQEMDHVLEWVAIENAKEKLFVPMQNWALDVALQIELC